MSLSDDATGTSSAVRALEKRAWEALAAKNYGLALNLFGRLRQRAPEEPRSLYGLARAQHAAGRIDAAEANYKRYLSSQPRDPERLQAARERLRLIQSQRIRATVRDAEHHGRNGRHALAARLYFRAWRQQPDEPQLLLQSARAEYRAGDLVEARKRFETYLNAAPSGDPDKVEVRELLARIRTGLTYGARAPSPQPVVVRKAAEPSTASWVVLASGAAVAAGGLWLYLDAVGDEEALYRRFQQRNEFGLIVGMTHTDATARARAIETRQNVAGAVGGVALVTTAVGLYLLLTDQFDDDQVPEVALGVRRASLRWVF